MDNIMISIDNIPSDIENNEWELISSGKMETRKRQRVFNSTIDQKKKRNKHIPQKDIFIPPYVQYHQDKVTKMYIGVFTLLMILCMILIICIEYYKYNTLYNTYLITHNKTISYSLFTECYQYRNMEYVPEKCL